MLNDNNKKNEQNPQSLQEQKADIKESFDQDNFSVTDMADSEDSGPRLAVKKSATPQMPISARPMTYKQGNDYVVPQN